jgi:phage terminase small subunit
MKKLTKKEIAEGIQAIPIERVLLGANSKNGIRLTKKQKHFAEEVVKTGNKTEAYRRAYTANGKRETSSRNANTIAKSTNVQTYITSLNMANEASEYLLPQRLRAMAVHKLSNMALNDELKPSEQLRALELVGKMTEVALFSERREIVHSLDSNTLKTKLMDAVMLAISNSKSLRTTTKRTAQELLLELSTDDATDVECKNILNEGGLVNDGSLRPTLPTPQDSGVVDAGTLHSIPHIGSPHIRSPIATLTAVKQACNPMINIEEIKEGVGVSKISESENNNSTEKPPVTVWTEKR